ncbi:hypothetical protein ACFFQF_25095 [Haladaptatus pallidirubidus]|nr:hypothetical protein [Haladaptatus pallidirubidus]
MNLTPTGWTPWRTMPGAISTLTKFTRKVGGFTGLNITTHILPE